MDRVKSQFRIKSVIESHVRNIANICTPWVDLCFPLRIPKELKDKTAIFVYMRIYWEKAERVKNEALELCLTSSNQRKKTVALRLDILREEISDINIKVKKMQRRMTRRKSAPVLKELVRREREKYV